MQTLRFCIRNYKDLKALTVVHSVSHNNYTFLRYLNIYNLYMWTVFQEITISDIDFFFVE